MLLFKLASNPWIQSRHLSLTALVSKRYGTNGHKVHRLAPNYLTKQTREEKLRVAHVMKKNQHSPLDLLRLSPRHVNLYNAQLAQAIARALILPQLKTQFCGKGVNISKVISSLDGKHVTVFWFSTQSNIKDAISKAFDDHRSEIRTALSQATKGSLVPQLKFRYDERHLASGYLEERFNLVDESLKMAEQQNALRQETENSPSKSATLFDEICRMPLRNDLFGIHRDVILSEIYKARHLAMASHRVTPKSGINEPFMNEFEGYLDKHYDNDLKMDAESRVNRFLGDKRKKFYKSIKTEEEYRD